MPNLAGDYRVGVRGGVRVGVLMRLQSSENDGEQGDICNRNGENVRTGALYTSYTTKISDS